MADIFSVIADATRRDILHILLDRHVLADGPAVGCSVSEIVTQLELSQPTVSKHLKVLRDAGLVTVREKGQHRYYSLDYSPLEQVEDWLIPFLSADFDAAGVDDLGDELAGDVAGGPADRRTGGRTGGPADDRTSALAAGSAALAEDVTATATAMALGRAIADTRHQVKTVARDISTGVSDGATKVATVFRRKS